MTKASSDLSIPDAVDVQSGRINITSGAVMVDSGLNVVVGSGVAIRSGLGVLISGQMVQLQSGYTMKLASGQIGLVSITDDGGSTKVDVRNVNDDGVDPSLVGLGTRSHLLVYDDEADKWNRVRTNLSGQGALVVATSGVNYVLTKNSGEVLKVQAPSALLAGYTVVGTQSGGVELVSGVVVFANVKSVSTSGDVWVGPPGILSGSGYLLQAGEEVGIDTDNLNNIYVISEVSGVNVSWMGEVV